MAVSDREMEIRGRRVGGRQRDGGRQGAECKENMGWHKRWRDGESVKEKEKTGCRKEQKIKKEERG